MDEDDFISKTRRKKQMTQLQEVGEALVRLAPEQLARLGLPETLHEAVLACRGITKHEARRRQMQYIGRLMRDVDAAPIVEQLRAFSEPSRKQTAVFHVAEQWRLEMLADDAAIDRFAREYPEADAKRLRAIVAAAREEKGAGRTPKHFREIFHAVNAILQDRAKGP